MSTSAQDTGPLLRDRGLEGAEQVTRGRAAGLPPRRHRGGGECAVVPSRHPLPDGAQELADLADVLQVARSRFDGLLRLLGDDGAPRHLEAAAAPPPQRRAGPTAPGRGP